DQEALDVVPRDAMGALVPQRRVSLLSSESAQHAPRNDQPRMYHSGHGQHRGFVGEQQSRRWLPRHGNFPPVTFAMMEVPNRTTHGTDHARDREEPDRGPQNRHQEADESNLL